jgi:hypothetical protein
MNVSNDFNEAFMGGGSFTSQECMCGRIHFCNPKLSHGDYEDGEYERLKELQKENPNRYIESESECVSYLDAFDSCIVWDCLCGNDMRMEKLFWNSRNSILEYYRLRMKKMDQEYWEFTENLKGTEQMSYLEFLNKVRDKKLSNILT